MRKSLILLAVGALIIVPGCTRKSPPPVPAQGAAAAVQPQLSGASYPAGLDYPLQPKPFTEVALKDSFWKPKMKLNAEVTIPHVWEKSSQGGRGMSGNVLQAAIYSLQTYPDPKLQAMVDSRVEAIKAAQGEKISPSNGLFEVAAAYYTATGKRDLLDIAVKSADLLYDTFKKQTPAFSGGERDAINCIHLYRVTHEKRYLDLAKFYLDIRGLENSVNRSRHNQSYKPVLEQSEAVGHAVNDASLMLSLLDVGELTGIKDYFDAAHRIWLDVIGTKLYITGGIGSTGNEGFGLPYSLPNLSAYCETCAAIMFTTFNHRLFLATGDSRYIDVMERTMYNNIIDGVTASGNRFFYVNRLASAGDGRDVRWEWASLPCCPPNLVRFMASMPGYIYAQGKDGIYVNLYISSDASFQIDGKDLSLAVESEMPWGGKSKIKVSAKEEVRGSIKLRIPGWARNQAVPGNLYSFVDKSDAQPKVTVNGESGPSAPDQFGYVSLDRGWKNGDVVEIEIPLEVRKIIADPKVRAEKGRMAVQRGPVVYCSEWPDYEGGHVLSLLFDAKGEFKPSFDKEFFGGAEVLTGEARNMSVPTSAPKPVKLIPYYLWANRGAGEMSVWLSSSEYTLGDTGPAGGLIFYVNPNYAADGWRYLEAAPFDQSAGAKWGCFRIPIEGARGTAVGTGRQNTKDIVKFCPQRGTAADICANFSLNGFSDWFLPSQDELLQMYLNLKVTGLADFGDRDYPDNFCYWTSTSVTTDMARHLDFADNARRLHYDDKDYPRRVRAVRAF